MESALADFALGKGMSIGVGGGINLVGNHLKKVRMKPGFDMDGGGAPSPDYKAYVEGKLAEGKVPLTEFEWRQKVGNLQSNQTTYEAFKNLQLEEFKGKALDVQERITIEITTDTGEVKRVQVNAIGVDADGRIRIQEYTTAKGGISIDRQILLEDLQHYGGVIVGKGKGKFIGGTKIDAGMDIDVISQKTFNKSITYDPDIVRINGEVAYLSADTDFNGQRIPVRDPKFLKPNGKIDWPAKGGFELDSNGNPITHSANLKKGMIVDRYGDDGGTFVSPVIDGQSFPHEARGLPYLESYQTKHSYEVLMDLNKENYEKAFSQLSPEAQQKLLDTMESFKFTAKDIYDPRAGKIAEVFGTGGGEQIKLGTSVKIYKQLGFLREVTP